MNKKEYTKPKSKHIIIASTSLLVGSDGDGNTVSGDFGGNDNGSGEAEGKFSLWEDED